MTNDNRKKEALQAAQDLESTGNTGTADFFRWLAENEKDAEALNKHWTCKKCLGNNGDEKIDDFGICEGCRKKDIDQLRKRKHDCFRETNKMKERPILFNAEMVRAVLDGRKTQTRRIVKGDRYLDGVAGVENKTDGFLDSHGDLFKCPYGKPGDDLWVRETHCYCDILNKGYLMDSPVTVGYRADKAACEYQTDTLIPLDTYAWNWKHDSIKWRPSIHMPRWASRIQVRITDVRVERVQEIRAVDIVDEGVCFEQHYPINDYGLSPCDEVRAFEAWINLWDSINEKRGYGWDKNPWVWVVEFEVVK